MLLTNSVVDVCLDEIVLQKAPILTDKSLKGEKPMISPCAVEISAIQFEFRSREDIRMDPIINIKIQLCEFGSSTSVIWPTAPTVPHEAIASGARPPYTFPKPVAVWEPDTITSSVSL